MNAQDKMTKRVLAIDDDESILTVMNNVLTMHDYEAVTATQWVEAIDAINDREPDLLLLDLQMPHVDGFFLLEWIREQEIDMPVIVVSAYLDDESVERLKGLGADAFVWKPFKVVDLVAKIDELIGSGTAAAPEEQAGSLDTQEPTMPAAVVDDPALGDPSATPSEDEPDGIRRRRRVRRRRRGTTKRERRRTAMYLAVIAVISIGISGLSIYVRNVASSVEEAVDEGIAEKAGEAALLKELLRVQIESQLEQERRAKAAAAPKQLDLNLQRK